MKDKTMITKGIKIFSIVVLLSSVIQIISLLCGDIDRNELINGYFIALGTIIMLVISIWFLVDTVQRLED